MTSHDPVTPHEVTPRPRSPAPSVPPAPSAVSTRRRFLSAAGLAGVAGTAVACGSGASTPAPPAPSSTAPPVSATTTPTASSYTGDSRAVALCAAMANLAAELYGEAGSVAGSGRLGTVPAVVSAYLGAAGGQHADAAKGWNDLLTAAGKPAVTGTPLTVDRARRASLDGAHAPIDLLTIALDLETSIAGTIAARLGEITDPQALALGASVAPVAAMHAATVGFLLGHPAGAGAGPDSAPLGPEALLA